MDKQDKSKLRRGVRSFSRASKFKFNASPEPQPKPLEVVAVDKIAEVKVDKIKIPLLINKPPKPVNLISELDFEVDKQLNKQTATNIVKIVNNCHTLEQDPRTLYDLRIKHETLESNYRARSILEIQKQQLRTLRDEQQDPITHTPGNNLKAYWITISLPPGYDNIEMSQKLMDKLVNTAVFKKQVYKYIYEWRDHDQELGCHVHLLLHKRKNTKPNKDMRTFKPSKTALWQDYGVIDKNKKAVKIKYVNSTKGLEIVEKYLAGVKDSKKMDKVDKDIELRQKLGIKQIYTN